MNKLIFVLFIMVASGCNAVNKLTGVDDSKGTPVTQSLVVVACCQKCSGGSCVYPSSVPESHARFCEDIHSAAVRGGGYSDGTGNIYLADRNTCKEINIEILGDEYYPDGWWF